MSSPAITPLTFPYKRKWTQAQIDEILERKDKLVDAMTDAVGPTGQAMYLPPEVLHILALHLSLAGGDVDDARAYIVSRTINSKIGDMLFADAREWLLKSEYEPAPPDPDDTKRKAQAAAEQIKRQLTPDVRAATMQILNETGEL